METLTMLWLHTGLIWSAVLAMMLAAMSAGLYLVQSSQLKSKHPGKILLTLPSLDRLDRIHIQSLTTGFVLFLAGILSGLFWAERKESLNEVLKDPRAILSLLTCALYGVVLAFRASALSRGQKIAAGTVLIFFLLLASVFISHNINPVIIQDGSPTRTFGDDNGASWKFLS
ncbi:MAG: cytochrome c biogenesis protein CcsA [Candidatus Omnitrophica bacterium]|nr:cytochrome c biogenesis protein CcsA [Candidatus Omnitrophota bacterium]